MYLIRAGLWDDPAEVRRRPGLWRRVRRFNLPVQLAVAVAEEVAAAAEDPASAALLSLAPCHSGSPQLFDAILSVEAEARGEKLHTPHINPTLTFHAVDNLALSSLAIALGNHAYGLGLGGAAGQAWVALEMAAERLAVGRESEALVIAGDQDDAASGSTGLAVALLFARRQAPYPPLGRPLRLAALERSPTERPGDVQRHAAAGLADLIAALERPAGNGAIAEGRFVYRVPDAQGDGRDRLRLVWEVE